jgi:hypothetical protein
MYIFDIDGTLANCEHRLKHIIGPKKNWAAFDREGHKDTPITPIVQICNAVYATYTYPLVLLTGRGERTREDTLNWLAEHAVNYDFLIMRPEGDHRPDTIVKWEQFCKFMAVHKFDHSKVQTIFEDRGRLVDMWRANGFHVCQVAEGDF